MIGDVLHGFKAVRSRDVSDGGVLREYVHEKTGAALVWLDRDEENKSFAIGFRTVPQDDTGVFHILEHSVLNGSVRYPVREPFVELLKSSLQTFLNAVTFPDKTVYPVASRNDKDFLNLISVYMDAVLHPLVYSRRSTFDQEGWHYEPTEDGSYIKNGVVLNEMRGAYSSVDQLAMGKLCSMLMPDTCYRHESGGHPEHISELTYEQFLDSHTRFYHPSNSCIFLDGSVDTDKVFALLDEFLAVYDKQELSFPIGHQEALPYSELTMPYPVAKDSDKQGKAILTKGYIACDFEDKEKRFALDLLCSYVAGDNDSPLTKAMLEKGLAQNVEAGILNEMSQPMLQLLFRNIDEANKDAILALTDDVLKNIVENGIDTDRMTALLDRAEFLSRESGGGWAPEGVSLALDVIGVWNYGCDPMLALQDTETYKSIREKMSGRYFETLIEDTLLGSRNCASLLLVPDENCEDETAAREAEKLKAEIAAMSDEQKTEINERFAHLREFQNTADSEESLATLPKLALSDVNRDIKKTPTERCGNVIFHTLPTKGIKYIELYFPLGGMPLESLPQLRTAISMLGKLATDKQSSAELSVSIKRTFGRFFATLVAYEDEKDPELCSAYVRVSASCLDEKADSAAELLKEILLGTRFDDQKRIGDILAQSIESSHQSFMESGHAFARSCAEASLTAAAAASDPLALYLWKKETADKLKAAPEDVCGGFKKVCDSIFTNGGLIVALTGGKDEKLAEKLVSLFPESAVRGSVCRFKPNSVARRGAAIPAPVSYTGSASLLRSANSSTRGAHKVLAQFLSYDYLWQEVRVKGGAYGTGMSITDSGVLLLHSYRDPSPAKTLDTFAAAGSYLRDTLSADTDLTGTILGTIAAVDPLLTADMQGRVATIGLIGGTSYEKRLKLRGEILDTTADQLVALADELDALAAQRKTCVVANSDTLAAMDLEEVTTV